ncbi:hypothetical protein COO60DRAFT_1519742, partial [Scenedesmus sp. NREL 46B-D3]
PSPSASQTSRKIQSPLLCALCCAAHPPPLLPPPALRAVAPAWLLLPCLQCCLQATPPTRGPSRPHSCRRCNHRHCWWSRQPCPARAGHLQPSWCRPWRPRPLMVETRATARGPSQHRLQSPSSALLSWRRPASSSSAAWREVGVAGTNVCVHGALEDDRDVWPSSCSRLHLLPPKSRLQIASSRKRMRMFCCCPATASKSPPPPVFQQLLLLTATYTTATPQDTQGNS